MKTSNTAARAKRQQMMLEDPMIWVISYVAIPMIVSTVIDFLYNLADTFFVSGLGETATAAVAVNDSLMNILRAVSMGFAMGAASYISRLMGANEDDEASNVATTTLAIGCIFSLLFSLGCLSVKSSLVSLLGSTPEAHAYSMGYATWILLAAPFTTANLIMNQLLRSEGSTTYAMVGMCSGCVLNCLLDPLFINTFGWGVAGAAGATALSKIFSCIVLGVPYKLLTFFYIVGMIPLVIRLDISVITKFTTANSLLCKLLVCFALLALANKYGDILKNSTLKVFPTKAKALSIVGIIILCVLSYSLFANLSVLVVGFLAVLVVISILYSKVFRRNVTLENDLIVDYSAQN